MEHTVEMIAALESAKKALGYTYFGDNCTANDRKAYNAVCRVLAKINNQYFEEEEAA